MERKQIASKRIGEQFTMLEHKSGLTMLLCPMQGYQSTYALFSANVGSVDAGFKTQFDDDFVDVPAGIAHFLEHKMFEDEDGDAFEKYAKTGASANAYTSFDKTAYLFNCTDKFEQSLEILLKFVRTPYFTKQSVEKEQGIIAQEIRMYDDDGDWRVMFNLLGALYHNHPVKVDIAGTVESIADIDADTLYRCHRTFYNLNNMVLTVAGNFDIDTVLSVADRVLKADDAPVEIERRIFDEPDEVAADYVEQALAVSMPLFELGFKGKSVGRTENFKNQILDEMLCEIIAGECSPLYRRLYDAGLISADFSGEVMAGRDYMCAMFSGDSRDPKRVAKEIIGEIERIQKDGLEKDLFEVCRRATYGRYIGIFARTESVAGMLAAAHFSGIEDPYSILDIVANTTLEELTKRLSIAFNTKRSALSVVWPVEWEQKAGA